MADASLTPERHSGTSTWLATWLAECRVAGACGRRGFPQSPAYWVSPAHGPLRCAVSAAGTVLVPRGLGGEGPGLGAASRTPGLPGVEEFPKCAFASDYDA